MAHSSHGARPFLAVTCPGDGELQLGSSMVKATTPAHHSSHFRPFSLLTVVSLFALAEVVHATLVFEQTLGSCKPLWEEACLSDFFSCEEEVWHWAWKWKQNRIFSLPDFCCRFLWQLCPALSSFCETQFLHLGSEERSFYFHPRYRWPLAAAAQLKVRLFMPWK